MIEARKPHCDTDCAMWATRAVVASLVSNGSPIDSTGHLAPIQLACRESKKSLADSMINERQFDRDEKRPTRGDGCLRHRVAILDVRDE